MLEQAQIQLHFPSFAFYPGVDKWFFLELPYGKIMLTNTFSSFYPIYHGRTLKYLGVFLSQGFASRGLIC